jgi:hypothetical protein
MEETVSREAKHDEVNMVMKVLNQHHLNQNTKDWHDFSDLLNDKMKSLGIGFNAPKIFYKSKEGGQP